MSTYSHTVDVNAPTANIFAILTSVARTPEFHHRCTGIDVLDPGPFALGQRLRYHYRDGRRKGSMEGPAEAFQPGQPVAFRFRDTKTEAIIDFHAHSVAPARTSPEHIVTIRAKGALRPLLSCDRLSAETAGFGGSVEAQRPRRTPVRRESHRRGVCLRRCRSPMRVPEHPCLGAPMATRTLRITGGRLPDRLNPPACDVVGCRSGSLQSRALMYRSRLARADKGRRAGQCYYEQGNPFLSHASSR